MRKRKQKGEWRSLLKRHEHERRGRASAISIGRRGGASCEPRSEVVGSVVRYAMLRYAMLSYATVRYAMLRYIHGKAEAVRHKRSKGAEEEPS